MSNSKVKMSERILAVLLSVFILLGFMPLTAFAETEEAQQAYTVTVKDTAGETIDQAAVTYDVLVNGEVSSSGNAVTNSSGIAEITGLSDYIALINAETTVGLSVKANKDGYTEGSGYMLLSNEGGNVDVTLTALLKNGKNQSATVTYSVDAASTGKGTVSVDGDTSGKRENVGLNSVINIQVTPNEGDYIASVIINGEAETVKTPAQASSFAYTVTSTEIDIVVKFVDSYTVELIAGEGGTISANGNVASNETKTFSIELGDSLNISAVANEGYNFSSGTINGKSVATYTTSGFSQNYEHLAANHVVDGKITVEASFNKVYTVEVSYDSSLGSVTSKPKITFATDETTNIAVGSVELVNEENVSLIILPETDYRVSAITVNGTTTTYDEISKSFPESSPYVLEKGQDYNVVVEFSVNQHEVKITGLENATATLNREAVENNGSIMVDHRGLVNIAITPETDYQVNSVIVRRYNADGTSVDETLPVDLNDSDSGFTDTVETITGDVEIIVEILSINTVEVEYPFNVDDALRVDGNTYVFKPGIDAVFTADESHDKIKVYHEERITPVVSGDAKTVTVSSDSKIRKIRLTGGSGGAINIKGITEQNPLYILFDSNKPETTLGISAEDSKEIYSGDVSVNVNVSDAVKSDDAFKKLAYTGIQSIEYIISDGITVPTEWTTLYTYNEAEGIVNDYIGTILVDSSIYNTANVTVTVRATDRAGNAAEEKDISLNINATAPTVGISMTGDCTDCEATDNVFYCEKRTATITIKDRADTFNKDNASSCINIKATDINGNVISDNVHIGEWNSNDGTHTATITFNGDAKYEWSFGTYTNKAGLSNASVASSGVNVFAFTVDGQAPSGEISIDEDNAWNELLEILTFGIWKNSDITVTATASDDISGVKSISYYKSNSETALTKEALDAAEFTETPVTVSSDEKFVVYARFEDNAGNVKYISTDGLIVDKSKADIVITPEEPNENKLYNSDVKVDVSVKDEGSGIKNVEYIIKHNGEIAGSGTLYSRNNDTVLYEYTGSFVVDGKQNNLDNVSVTVVVTDNAGVVSEKSVSLNINTSTPEVDIKFYDSFNANNYRKEGYFTSRIAEITITDRASAFNIASAEEAIKVATVGSDVNSYYNISNWVSDGDKHTATVEFIGDAHYNWSFSYTNLAGNSTAIYDPELKLDDEDNKYRVFSAEDSSQKPNELRPFDFVIDNGAPTGEVQIESNAWTELLEIITFGAYDNDSFAAYATANDTTSPLILEYFKTDSAEAMTVEALEAQQFTAIQLDGEVNDVNYLQFLNVTENERFTVYLKIADYAGNYVYISSDGHILDKKPSNITLNPDNPVVDYENSDKNNDNMPDLIDLYNSDVNIGVVVTDEEISSGIKEVTYFIELLNDNGTTKSVSERYILYKSSLVNPSYDELIKKWEGNILVDSETYNWSKVRVTVEVMDNAENVSQAVQYLDIDVTKPTISVTYNNNNDNDGNGYFNKERTAIIVITERANHFDSKAATNGISITATDVQGKTVDGTYEISSWNSTQSTEPDKATHTATVKFKGDANYTFAIKYTDKAQNSNASVDTNNSVAPYKFTVDKTAPTGSVKAVSSEGRSETWDKLVDTLNFGFWSNSKISIFASSQDKTSPIASVEYYKASSKSSAKFTSALTKDELNNITSWTAFSAFDVLANEQFTVYLKITDMAGNITYLSTNGMIVDDTAPREEVNAPTISLTPQQAASGIYSSDVKIPITVDDPLLGGTYSGLRTVSYRVLNMGQVTQSGTLFSFTNTNPYHIDLTKTWTGEITVDSELNNSNDVVIEVFAEDNSLNSSTNSISIKIDTTAPVINVSYNNNNAVGDLFNADRVATIVVTERNFSPDEVVARITNTDNIVPSLSAWSVSGGSGNGDDTRWTATVTFSADGDYTFDIACTDLAGHTAGAPNFAASTVAPTAFTIDKTVPVISVSYNNSSDNNYFNTDRTATITIDEHNFNAENVNISITATEDGTPVTVPAVSSWTGSGDRHTATIVYNQNAKYTFNISYTDEAANPAAAFSEHVFYVDKTAPTLNIDGVENESAYKDEVAPVIEYSDVNLDADSVTITLSGVTRGNNLDIIGEYSDIKNGQIFTFDNFAEEKAMDDIYTLTVSLRDKAGNTSEETVKFSVNRFGSTYDMSEDTNKLNGSFVTSANDVIITEVNATELSDIIITLFKNNETIVLEEGVDYTVDIEGGSGQWYKYIYTILEKNFTDDGVYRISVHSEDKAGNVAENTLDTKDMEIGFGVDKTPPTVVVANTENGKTYAKDNHTVIMTADDNLKLEKVTVFLDGSELKAWSKEEVEAVIAANGEFNFDIAGDSTKAHSIKIVCVDSAGNETIEEVTDFFVTTNLFVRYYNNKLLFFGSIAGIIVLLGLIIFLIVFKRRKRENNR